MMYRTRQPLMMYLGYLLLFFVCHTQAWAGARAFFDRDTISQGETAILTIETDYPANGHSPDLGLLTRDFTILDTRRGGGRREINGRTVSIERWEVHLEARRSGIITVPAFHIGQGSTIPVTLNVLAVPDAVTPDEEDIFLEVEVEPRTAYVQSQVRYTQRLLYAIPLQEGELTNAGIEGVRLERLGEDLSYVDARDGRLYRVTERHYVLFPQRSGELTIPATRFEGRMAMGDADGQLAGLQRGRPITLSSEPISLSVRPQPARFSGDTWLPSEDLLLSERWSDTPPQFRVGEPVTRTLLIEAAGLDGAQLPEVQLQLPDDFNVYMGLPEIATNNDGVGIRGRREQQIVIQPTQAGRYTLPEVRLAWWDIHQNREQLAVLPAMEIEVLAVAGTVLPQPSTSAPVAIANLREHPYLSQNIWFWTSASLLLLWLGTLLLWWRSHQTDRQHHRAIPQHNNPGTLTAARRNLEQACKQNDPLSAARALLAWSAQRWPASPPRSLTALAQRLDQGGQAVVELDQFLYAPDDTRTWQGSELWQALRGGLLEHPAPSPPASPNNLPDLYPERA